MLEKFPRVAVAAFIFDQQGRVLLIERGHPPAQGLWTVPGGKVRWGESLADALTREVAEETGLAVAPGPLVTVFERRGPEHHFVILDYLARIVDSSPAAQQPTPGDDAADARWLTDGELTRLPLTDGLLSVLVRARTLWRAQSAA